VLLRRRFAFAFLVLVAFVTGCSGPGGFLNTVRYPKGNIVVSSYPGGVALNTSATSPYAVDSTFSVSISETNFSGPYTVTMYSWKNGFNEPCFEPHTKSATIYTFSPDNAAAAGVPNPCAGGEVETALINDGKGHDVYFSFESSQAIVTGANPTPTPTPTASSGSATACSGGDPQTSSISVTGAQQPFTFPSCNDFTIAATLPANGGAGDTLSLATSSSTEFGDSTTASNGTPILSLALEPSPSEIAFTNSGQSISTTVTSPSKLGGGTYTMELRENNQIIETITQITPTQNAITFNIYPISGTLDLSEYVAIIYKN